MLFTAEPQNTSFDTGVMEIPTENYLITPDGWGVNLRRFFAYNATAEPIAIILLIGEAGQEIEIFSREVAAKTGNNGGFLEWSMGVEGVTIRRKLWWRASAPGLLGHMVINKVPKRG